jgi:hypothetical protein
VNSQFVLVNFFLAIVMEAYEQAKAEIEGTNSVRDPATLVLIQMAV